MKDQLDYRSVAQNCIKNALSHAELQLEQGCRAEEEEEEEKEDKYRRGNVQLEVMVRTQEVRDSRVTESHAELQQEQEQGRREEERKGGRVG